VFDVNETLSDMAPMEQRFADVGAHPLLARTWFASLLRDGFALTAVGASERFATLGEGRSGSMRTSPTASGGCGGRGCGWSP
jgi:2-haloacid dehalogenase